MAYTMEQRTVCAHKQGRMMSIFARNMTRSAVEQEAKLLFSTSVAAHLISCIHALRHLIAIHTMMHSSPPWCRHR